MNLKIVLGSQAAQKCGSACAPFGASSPLPMLSHSAQHLPGSSSAAHLLSLLKDTSYTSLHYGDPFHSNTLQDQNILAEVPMWFQPVSDVFSSASPCLARNTQVDRSLSSHHHLIAELCPCVCACDSYYPQGLLTSAFPPPLSLHLFQHTKTFPLILLYEAAGGMVLTEQNSELFLL